MGRPTDLSSVLEQIMFSFMENIHTISVGRIEKYYGHESRRAVVMPLVRPWLQCGAVVEQKPIDNVPVVFPSTSGAGVILPVREGDGVLLLFAESGIGEFLVANRLFPVDADGPTRFASTDCIAIPGLWPFAATPAKKVPNDTTLVYHGETEIALSDDGFSVRDGAGNVLRSTSSGLIINENLEVLR